MDDILVRALSRQGGLRILAAVVKGSAREIANLQKPSRTASIALGRAVAAGALMGALLKDGQRVALKFEGNGDLKKLIVEADYDGAIRCTLGNPSAELPPINNRYNVAELIGKAGFLTVSKDLGFGKEPYNGTVQLCTSEIGDDLAYYLTDSEQIPSAVALSASLDSDGVISEAGGFLVQSLPNADEEEIDKIMANISKLPPLAPFLSDKDGIKALIAEIFGDIPFVFLEEKNIFFRCGCSIEKVESALTLIDKKELEEIKKSEEECEVVCEFCKQRYVVDPQIIDKLLQNR